MYDVAPDFEPGMYDVTPGFSPPFAAPARRTVAEGWIKSL
jgi:hypothetical protein